MEKKFIKGDWYLQSFTDVYTNIVRSNQGEGFETAWVCNIHGSCEENRPTAQLISCAPEMLQALVDLKNSLELISTGYPPVDRSLSLWRQKADNIIKKALEPIKEEKVF